MAKNITKTFELFKFLTFDKLIDILSNKAKFEAIYTVSPNGKSFASWEESDPLKQFDKLILFKGYFLDTKLSETFPYDLYTEDDEYYCNEIIDTEFSIATYKGPDLDINSVFGDKALQIFKVSDSGKAFESWQFGSIFNEFDKFKDSISYIIISNTSKLPYILWDNCFDGSGSGSGSMSGSGSDSGSGSEPDVCYSNVYNLLLNTCPIDCYQCISNEIEEDIECDIGSDCSECYSPSLVIPVAC